VAVLGGEENRLQDFGPDHLAHSGDMRAFSSALNRCFLPAQVLPDAWH
jgi:hypothetical protein